MDISDLVPGGEEVFGEGESTFEMRIVNDVVYLSFPPMIMGEIADTSWVSVDGSSLTDEELMDVSGIDVGAQLDFLLGVDDQATISYDEEINGVSATRISGKSSMKDIVDQLTDEERKELLDSLELDVATSGRNIENAYLTLETLQFSFDVWIDENRYILRQLIVVDNWYDFLISLDPAIEEEREYFDEFGLAIDMYLYDYGAPIAIVPPPEEDVTFYPGSLDDLLA